MITANKIITTVMVALALAVAACAGMTPASQSAVTPAPSSHDLGRTTPARAEVFSLWADWPGAAGLDFLPSAPLPGATPETQATCATKSPQVLTDNQSSLSLCLYVLMGAGLCRSLPLMKRLSLGCIPDWYHDGGPFQVGHSHAITPDLCPASLLCFIQPQSVTEDSRLKCDRATITSLVRESLFTPSLLASRAPPSDACGLRSL